MRDRVLHAVKTFLEAHYLPGKPLLLGLSGGADSLALLHALLECRRFFPLDLHLAHVDHGWRQESAGEAELLRQGAERLTLPFHLCRLAPPVEKKNLEDRAREERLSFFSKVYQQIGCQALLLAHQREDQAETVLKRLLEGAGLSALGGLRQTTFHHEMVIWRPLLQVTKDELINWLGERGLAGFEDATNQDPKYLRARMRVQIFPTLEKMFGKQIAGNLHRLGASAQELEEYLDRKIAAYFSCLRREEGRICIDLTPFFPLEKVEFRAFFKKWMQQEAIFLSHANIEMVYELLIAESVGRRLPLRDAVLFVDAGHLKFEKVFTKKN